MKKILFEYMSNNGIRLHNFLHLTSAEHKDVETAKILNVHKLMINLSGTSRHIIDGHPYIVSPMDICIVPPNRIHAIEFDGEEPCETITLTYTQNLLPTFPQSDILSAINDPSHYHYIIPSYFVKKYELHKLLIECKQICQQADAYSELEIVIHLLMIIRRIAEIASTEELQASKPNIPLKSHTLSYLAVQYIKKHLCENFSLQTLAGELHVSVSHLRQTFKKELGITLHDFILESKMRLAFNLLSQGEAPLIVSQKLGYEYYSTFYQHYVKRFHTIPKQVFLNVNKQRTFSDSVENLPQNN